MIARLYDAYGCGDVDGILACYVGDLVFHVAGPEPTAGDHAGLRAILEQYMPLLDEVDHQVLDTVEGPTIASRSDCGFSSTWPATG